MRGILSGGMKIALGIAISRGIIFLFRKALYACSVLVGLLFGLGYDVKTIPIWIIEKFDLAVAYTKYYAAYGYNYAVFYVQTINEKLAIQLPMVPAEVLWGLLALSIAIFLRLVLKGRRSTDRNKYDETHLDEQRTSFTPNKGRDDFIVEDFI